MSVRMMRVRNWLLGLAMAAATGVGIGQAPVPVAPVAPSPQGKAAPEKVLRYAFRIAETGFDPAQLSDLYSRILTANIFDALYAYDYLARPAQVVPNVAEGMPEVSADFRTYTVRLKKGIYFADDPAFGGKKRELTAHDYAYTYKRFIDPKLKSPSYSRLTEEKIVGVEQLRKAAVAPGVKFNYDGDLEGIRALDRYTIQFKLEEPRPRFIYTLADAGVFGAVAREVMEKYDGKTMEHPVGTGPFMLGEWRRSSKITLVKNPNYRDVFYSANPPANDPVAQATAQKFKGRKLPMIDKVEISIIEESQPRWLAFLGQEHDLMERLPEEVANLAIPNNKLAPNLAKKGIGMMRVPAVDITMMYFGMENPVVGGYTPEKVALRRAISMAYNVDEEVRLPRRNQAIVAQGPVYMGSAQYDANLRTENGIFDRARAMALLDTYGYTDKNGDGWRDLPDGKPLLLEFTHAPINQEREISELWKRNMDAIGIKIVFKIGQWPENLKASRAGKLMMWIVAFSSSDPNGAGVLEVGYSGSIGGLNHARFRNAEYDALYLRQLLMPDGPERQAVIAEAVKLLIAYAPYKYNTHRFLTDMTQPWVMGYSRHPNMRQFWQFVDIDTSKLPAL